jgi:hypothetical protein
MCFRGEWAAGPGLPQFSFELMGKGRKAFLLPQRPW